MIVVPRTVLNLRRNPDVLIDLLTDSGTTLEVLALRGGLLDGPVYRSIYASLKGITLHQPDEYARFNTGRVVYHDDLGDYSTNEPIMDGTASLAWMLAILAEP